MVLASDQVPPGQDWLVQRIATLERAVRELAAARRLEASRTGGLTFSGGTIYDAAGNVLFSSDPASGVGLGAPYFLCGLFVSMEEPTNYHTSTTFELALKAVWRKQHSGLRLVLLHSVTATTAEFRLRVASGPDAGTVMGGPILLDTGFDYDYYGPFSLPGAHLSEFEIDLDVRVASGAGGVDVEVLAAIGMQV